MSKLSEVIASAFASGLAWRGSLAGKEVFCPLPGLNEHEVMSALEQFLEDTQLNEYRHVRHVRAPGDALDVLRVWPRLSAGLVESDVSILGDEALRSARAATRPAVQ